MRYYISLVCILTVLHLMLQPPAKYIHKNAVRDQIQTMLAECHTRSSIYYSCQDIERTLKHYE